MLYGFLILIFLTDEPPKINLCSNRKCIAFFHLDGILTYYVLNICYQLGKIGSNVKYINNFPVTYQINVTLSEFTFFKICFL